ncbi:MAG TPA: hypothetical protein VFF30_03085 [Nitrososphaerales archaeon]|nr:hypothetical protein [Nitrososphaerales archaeon]
MIATTSKAYLFLTFALIFGLPLMLGYLSNTQGDYLSYVVEYLLVTVVISLLIVYFSRRSQETKLSNPNFRAGAEERRQDRGKRRLTLSLGNLSVYWALSFATLTVVAYAALRVLIVSSYPKPPPDALAEGIGSAYLVLLAVTAVLTLSKLMLFIFKPLGRIFAESERRYDVIAVASTIAFVLTYLFMVNQILISGYNTNVNLPSPFGTYPFAHVFTVGPQQAVVSSIYLPYALIQISPVLNLLFIPFEVLFALLTSLLVSANLTMGYYLIRNSGLRYCVRGTLVSTSGSIIGLTATCPTCLAPTIVSVLFGGISAAELIYSNIYGVILPPVISIATLMISLYYLSNRIVKVNETGAYSSLSPLGSDSKRN